MITLKPIVIPGNRRKDGTYPVKIRITYKGVSRRLPTTLVATPNDITRSLKIKSPDIINKCNALIAQMREAIGELSPFELENRDVDFVVAKIKRHLSSESFRLDFFAWADEAIKQKQPTTALSYKVAVNSFARFIGRRELDINDITQALLNDYLAYLRAEVKHTHAGPTKIRKRTNCTYYLDRLGHIYSLAKRKYNDEDLGYFPIPRSPFSHICYEPEIHTGQRNLGKELMQRIIDYKCETARMRVALDAFLLSFLLMGVNHADMFEAKPFTGRVWMYNRKKTRRRRSDKAQMYVTIPDQAKPIIKRLQASGGNWWLPELHTLNQRSNGSSQAINSQLAKWCKVNGVEPFTFYAARHTWASLARSLGEKATVDECLGHVGDYRIADIYAERDWEKINNLNQAVINLFDWTKQ